MPDETEERARCLDGFRGVRCCRIVSMAVETVHKCFVRENHAQFAWVHDQFGFDAVALGSDRVLALAWWSVVSASLAGSAWCFCILQIQGR